MLANTNPAPAGDRAGLDTSILAERQDGYLNTAIAEYDQSETGLWSEANFVDPARLVREMHRHAKPLDQQQIQWLKGRGVSIGAMAGAGKHAYRRNGEMEPNVLFSAEICVVSPGAFEWPENVTDEAAKPAKALIWFGLDTASNPVDVCAYVPRNGEIATLTGAADVADESALSQFDGEPLPCFFDPLDWLRAGRNGALIIDHGRHGGILRWCDHLTVAGAADGARLKRLVALKSPKISVRRPK